MLSGALRSEDTAVMLDGLRQINVQIEQHDAGRTLRIDGSALKPFTAAEPASLYIANSGTTVRFLTAFLSALGGNYRLHGVDRMHARPIGELLTAIQTVVDGTVVAESAGGCPPVRIDSRGWHAGTMTVGGKVSSQYLSGLLMAAPLSRGDCQIEVDGELVSKPYVQMTCQVMRAFGVPVSASEDLRSFHIPALRYALPEYEIEPDASAASYFWATAAITGGSVRVEGLTANALQGDVGFVDVLAQMGCRVEHEANAITVHGGRLQGIDVNMNAISDTVQTLAVVALFADRPTRISGVAHNRFKETDRIGDLARELRKLGTQVTETADGLEIEPLTTEQQQRFAGATLVTYHDHRMAMSLALCGLRLPNVQIENPACTAKTYPEYFADLERLIGRPHYWRSAAENG